MVEWIEPELIWVFCPAFANVFVSREASQGFQALGEVVSGEEGSEMFSELVVAVIMVAADGCLFQRAVHAFDLAIRPGMLRLCEPVIDVAFGAGVLKSMGSEDFASGQAFLDLLGLRTSVARRGEVGAVVG